MNLLALLQVTLRFVLTPFVLVAPYFGEIQVSILKMPSMDFDLQ